MQQVTTIEMDHHFHAAHHLPESNSLTTKKCLNNHGHTYGVKVFIEATQLDNGFVSDFGLIKDLIDELDHAQLIAIDDTIWRDFYDNIPDKRVIIPYATTAENLARYLYDLFNDHLPLNAQIKEVWVREGIVEGKVNWVKYHEIEA